MASVWDSKIPVGVRPGCHFEISITMHGRKHCYGVQTYEYYTTVEYNLGLEAFFHAMAFLNSAVRVAVLLEEKGQPVFSNPSAAKSGHMAKKKEKSTVQQLADIGGVFFYVKVKKSNLYQSMLFVDDSLIAGAGQGLFLRPDQHGNFYRKNTVMCFYSMVTLSNEQVLELPSSNYLMKVRNGYIDATKTM